MPGAVWWAALSSVKCSAVHWAGLFSAMKVRNKKKHRQFQKLSFMIDPPPEPVLVNVLRSPGIRGEIQKETQTVLKIIIYD